MNAVKELMCGDWVLINNAPHRIQAIDSINAEILADDELYYVGEDRYRSEDKIEGIPITPEILEKNELQLVVFSNGKTIYSRLLGTEEFCPVISLLIDEEKWKLDIKNYYSKKYLKFISFHSTLYIHELQHALRLCELNELADNFKV